jgi:Protein of unknown function (DUF3631)
MPSTSKASVGAQIVSGLESTFRKYVALDGGLSLVLALWAFATHLFDCFDAFSYLAITSPTKQCGKTRLAEVLELLSCGALRTAAASPAAVFRTIQARTLEDRTVTFIMDEAELLGTKSERADQLREILNAGYRRGQSVFRVERATGEKFEVKEFNVYCPKVLVLIGRLTDTLADRCIPISMRRRRASEQLSRFFFSRAQYHARPVLKELEKWVKENRASVKRHARRDLEFLQDREAELWLPLFAVCQVAAPERLAELKRVALHISRGKRSEEPADYGVLVLRDIKEVFTRCGGDRMTSSMLLAELQGIEESPWANWSSGRGLDSRGLARLLRSFRVEPHNLRMDGQILKGYERTDFEEPWATYLPPDSSATPLQANESGPESQSAAATKPLL